MPHGSHRVPSNQALGVVVGGFQEYFLEQAKFWPEERRRDAGGD